MHVSINVSRTHIAQCTHIVYIVQTYSVHSSDNSYYVIDMHTHGIDKNILIL